jgi:hypothetical protein
MEYRIIKTPSKGTMELLLRRMGSGASEKVPCCDAVGLVQGRLIDMVYAADIAEKAVGVAVEDIRGSCPQNMIMIAIFGDTAAVEEAINKIKHEMKDA